MLVALAALGAAQEVDAPPDAIALRTKHLAWVIGADGINLRFMDRMSGRDWLDGDRESVAFLARIGAKVQRAVRVERIGDRIGVTFEDPTLTAALRVAETQDAVLLDVLSASDRIEELTFGVAALALKGASGEPFAACVLARNLKTNVPELPGACSLLRALAYQRLGIAGASAAIVAAPSARLRTCLQRVIAASPELPRSPIGGPWALASPHNRRSYLFNFGGLNVARSKPWTDLARALGAGQIDFHGGTSFRFGDFLPDPGTYPNGTADLKATVDALHSAGLQAGLHTYAFFIDKRSKYVTPVPDKRLASARTFTLAQPLNAVSDTITVLEPTTGINATTGFFVTNSATLRIGDELMTFREATQSPPWRFTGCVRGALGTKASYHEAGSKADHLKELFGLFAPDAESDLFIEIIENTARTYNECGFDMIYLDALDGSYIHAGPEWAWHYGARFVYELAKRLKKPAIMEMSTFHHHLWCVRARMGAWDAPHTGYKEFVDMHRVVNADCARMYLPSHLGWWGVFAWNGVQPERTLPDDLEYLLCKALADDAGVSFVQGFAPDTFPKSPGAQRYAAMIRKYEDLRRAHAVPAWIRKRLGTPREEFTLQNGPKGQRAFVPVRYAKLDLHGTKAAGSVANGFAAQPLSVRLEARLSVDGNAPPRPPLLSPADLPSLTAPRSAEGVRLDVGAGAGPEGGAPGSPPSAYVRLSASSTRSERRGAWAAIDRVLPAPVDLARCGLGVWIHGDGKGEVLNFQLRAPEHLGPGVAEHYVVVDFTGWRYCELIEPEGDRLSHYSWPYAAHRADWERNGGLAFTSAYKTYHPWLYYQSVNAITIWMNEIPAGSSVECLIGPVVPLPLTAGKVRNPNVTVGDRTLAFPCEIASGQYLEMDPSGVARLFGLTNEELGTVTPNGSHPSLSAGANEVRFACQAGDGPAPRARLTVVTRGKPLRF